MSRIQLGQTHSSRHHMELRRPELLEQEIHVFVVNGDIGFGSESFESSGRGREVDGWLSSDPSLSPTN